MGAFHFRWLCFVECFLLVTSQPSSVGDGLLIGAFNVKCFGEKTCGKQDVMENLVKIIRRYHIILIQEIRDENALDKLLTEVNKSGQTFCLVTSKRLGSTPQKEQYSFLIRSDSRITVEDTYQYPENSDLFERPPFSIKLHSEKLLDIIFVLDESESISEPDFQKQLTFVQNLVHILGVGPDGTHVGVETFGTTVGTIVQLNEFNNPYHLKKHIDAIRQNGGSTGTHLALMQLREMFGQKYSRPGAFRVAIIITDGKSDKPEDTASEAKRVHAEGIVVFAIGVGRVFQHLDLLKRIANPTDYVFTVDNYNDLNLLVSDLANKAYHGIGDFVLTAIHTKPACAFGEIGRLKHVHSDIKNKWGTDNILIMGDLNVPWPPTTSLTPLRKMDIQKDPFLWLIDDNMNTMTTVSKKEIRAYDRFIMTGKTLKQSYVRDSAHVDEHLSPNDAQAISDHYPIQLKLRLNTQKGSQSKRKPPPFLINPRSNRCLVEREEFLKKTVKPGGVKSVAHGGDV